MAPLKEAMAMVAAVLWLASVDSFLTPVPVGTGRASNRALARSAAVEGVRSRPQGQYATGRHASMSAASSKGPSSSIGADESSPASSPRPSRFSRISGRVKKMIRKAMMGYVPEEEVSYKQRAAQQAAAAARLRGEPEIADERLRADSMSAKSAAIEAVEDSLALDDDEDDILNSGFVQLRIGDQSPMEAEDKLASLRSRLEKGLPPDTAQEQAEKRKLAMQQQLRQQRKQRPPSSSRPPSFDGDTAVAERPSSPLNSPKASTNEGSDARPTARSDAPKLASAEDIERLNRMFGYGEPLR